MQISIPVFPHAVRTCKERFEAQVVQKIPENSVLPKPRLEIKCFIKKSVIQFSFLPFTPSKYIVQSTHSFANAGEHVSTDS